MRSGSCSMPGWRDEGSHNSRKRVPEKRLKRDASQVLVRKIFVLILYQTPAFGAFDDFDDFLESISCGTSKTCQVCGSNPCLGAKFLNRVRTPPSPFPFYYFPGSSGGRFQMVRTEPSAILRPSRTFSL